MAEWDQRSQRPGGRSARVRAAVLDAAFELAVEGGIGAVTMSALAQRSGVNRTSIYRRWGSGEAVLADLAGDRLPGWSAFPDTGTLRGDLEEWVTLALTAMKGGGSAPLTLMRHLLTWQPTDPDEQVRRREQLVSLLGRTNELGEVLARAAGRGEPVPTVDDIIDLLIAPLYFRYLLEPMLLPDDGTAMVNRLLTVAKSPD